MTTGTLPAAPPPLPEVEHFLDLVHQRDGRAALELVSEHMRRGGTVSEVVIELLAPAQRAVGERWHAGAWSVADEHVASAVVEDALGVLAAHVPRSSGSDRLTLVCAEGEWHVTPARMAAIMLRDAGWHVDFLGGSTPVDHLETALAVHRPGVLAISATLPLSLAGVAEMVQVAHRAEIPVLVGGAAFAGSDHRARLVNADGHASDLAAAGALLREWLDHPPTRPMDGSDPAWRRERASLLVAHDDLVAATYRLLEQRIPAMASYSERQREHTRRDLAYTLRFLQAALLVEDPELFHEYSRWLSLLLERRGVPPGVVRTSYDALAEVVGPDRPVTRAMLLADVPA